MIGQTDITTRPDPSPKSSELVHPELGEHPAERDVLPVMWLAPCSKRYRRKLEIPRKLSNPEPSTEFLRGHATNHVWDAPCTTVI